MAENAYRDLCSLIRQVSIAERKREAETVEVGVESKIKQNGHSCDYCCS